MVQAVRLSPINDAHVELGAQMIEYGGYSVPARYENTLEEYLSARHAAGLFDLSHLKSLILEGRGAVALLQSLSATDVSPLSEGLACRVMLCNEQGGIIDAFTAYPLEDGVLCASGPPYATVCTKYLENRAVSGTGRVSVVDHSSEYARFAIHGPHAKEILRGMKAHTSLIYARKPGFCGTYLLDGLPIFTSLSDYTGEKGFELLVPRISALNVWSRMSALGARPCGLAALDILRVEAGRRACGHELTPEIGPAEAGFMHLVAFDKGDFPGRMELQKQRNHPRRKLIGLRSEPMNVFTPGQTVYIDGEPRGRVTSGCANPERGGSVALALIDANAPNGHVHVEDKGRRRDAVLFEI